MQSAPNMILQGNQFSQGTRNASTNAIILLVLLLWACVFTPAGQAAMKLGIIADPEFADSAALITAELAKTPDAYELLEREAIDHVLQEQGLAKSGATAGDWVKAGRILAADGLVLLQKRNMGEKETANVGWVLSVNTGIVLGAEILPKDSKAQLDALKGLLEHCRTKLAVKSGEAVPVSIIPAEAAANTLSSDREIFQNGLMLTLMREPTVFILQREQLETILFERNFAGADSQGFWAGANVVQCSVGPDPLDKGILSASLTLNRREGGSETWVEKAQTPQELAAKAASSLRERLKLSSTAPAYDPQKELTYFREKFNRLKRNRYGRGYCNDPALIDTVVTLQALGEKSFVCDQYAVFAPVIKVCGTAATSKIMKAQAAPKDIISAVRQMVQLEQTRLQTLAKKENLDNRSLNDDTLMDTLMRIVERVSYYYYLPRKETNVEEELHALRQQMRDYFRLANELKWDYPLKYLLEYGEYCFDDPKEWLDCVEAALCKPGKNDSLEAISKWIRNTVMQVPRHEGGDLFDGAATFNAPRPTPSPATLAIAVPRMILWTQSKEPALRIAGARILLRDVGIPVDRPAMARIAVQALGEILAVRCKGKNTSYYVPSAENSIGFWLKKVEPLAHKELLELSIRTLGWAERPELASLFTQPANKEEALLLGNAYNAATERLHTQPQCDAFEIAKGHFPEAFAANAPQNANIIPAPSQNIVRTAKLVWSSNAALPQFAGRCQLSPISESAGKLWCVLGAGENEKASLRLLSIDPQTRATSTIEIPVQQREKFRTRNWDDEFIFSVPDNFLANEDYFVMGPVTVKNHENENIWMIMNRRTGGWKEVAVPPPPRVGSMVYPAEPVLIQDKVFWPFSLEHPEKLRGLLEIHAAEGSWKFHPCDPFKEMDFYQTNKELRWNRHRNTLTLITNSLVAEFDLQNNRWLDTRPIAGVEARLSRNDLRSGIFPESDYAKNEFYGSQLDADPAMRAWKLNVIDPITQHNESFELKMDVQGVELSANEKQVVEGFGSTNRFGNIHGNQTRNGLWFKLETEYHSICKLFWLPWADIRKDTPPQASLDLLIFKNGNVFSSNNNHLENTWDELQGGYKFLDHNARTGTVLLVSIRPPYYAWGQREANGRFTWRALSIPEVKWGREYRRWSAQLSPDGMGVRYITSSLNEIREWRADSGEDKLLFTPPEGKFIQSFAYAEDGASFAWSETDILHWQPASGNPQEFPLKVTAFYRMHWSPDGKYLAAHVQRKIQIMDRNGESLALGKNLPANEFFWAANSAQMISRVRAGDHYELQLTDIADGGGKMLLPGFSCNSYIPSADGLAVLGVGYSSNSRRCCILRIPLDGSPWKEVSEGSDCVDFLPQKAPMSAQGKKE